MVKLRVVVRVIPEDGYLASLRTGDAGLIEGERKFAEIVREPEEWYIGTLARVVEASYKRRYKCDLGKIKYLKAEDDCDLDPEDLVSDHFIDEGKAARDGADQSVIFKVIQEQGRALRAGSVIPDLTPVHYTKPLQKPPVPIFSDVSNTLGKHERQQENGHVGAASPKRMRLQGIEEEQSNTVVHSIEADEIQKSPEMEVQDSQTLHLSSHEGEEQARQDEASSPELGMPWLESTRPAKRTSKLFKKPDRPVKATSTDLKETASVSKESATADGSIGAVSTLNGLKSTSPAQGQSGVASAKKFQHRSRDIYAMPDSDIEDSQMSPRSRASTARITPRLVTRSNPLNPKDQASSVFSHDTPSKTPQNLREEEIAQSEPDGNEEEVASEGDSQAELDKETQSPFTTIPQNAGNTQALDGRVTSDGGTKTDSASNTSHVPTSSKPTPARGRKKGPKTTSAPNPDVEIIQHDLVQEATPTGKSKKRKRRRNGTENDQTSAKSTPISAAKKPTNATESAAAQLQKQIAVDTAVRQLARNKPDVREGSSDRDSPGAQLSQSLQEYTPNVQNNRKISIDIPGRDSPSINTGADGMQRLKEPNNTVREQVVQSGHTSDEAPFGQLHTESATKKSAAKRTKANKEAGLRCFTCWKNKSRCDNQQPKCSTCIRYKRICREYSLTKEAAEEMANNKDAVGSAGKKAKRSDSPLDKITVSKDETVQDDTFDRSPTASTASESEEEPKDIAFSSEENTAVAKNDKLAVPSAEHAARAESTESQVPAAKKTRTLPAGMTEEEYDRIIQSRAGLTEEQRIKQLRKKAGTPALTKTPSRDSATPAATASNIKKVQTAAEAHDPTPARKQTSTAPEGHASSATRARSPSVVLPVTMPTPVTDPKPELAKKPQPTPAKKAQIATNSKSATRTPKPAGEPSTIAATNKNNPPFKRQTPQSGTPSGPMTYSDAKSIKQVRELAAMKSAQESASNSPRSSILLPKTANNLKGRGANFLDADDSDSDEDDESDEDSEDENPRQPLASKLTEVSDGLSSPSKKPGALSKRDESDSSDDDDSSDTSKSSDETSSGDDS